MRATSLSGSCFQIWSTRRIAAYLGLLSSTARMGATLLSINYIFAQCSKSQGEQQGAYWIPVKVSCGIVLAVMQRATTGRKSYKMSDTTSQTPIEADLLIRNIGQLVTMAQSPIEGATGPLGIIEHAAVASNQGKICWIGRDDQVREFFPVKTGK